MKIIGLTGPTGAGKSSLNTVAQNLGFKVIDCDKFARKAVEKGTDGLKALISVFGEDILMPNGELNRKKLAEKAFSTTENTRLLNKILLPFIGELVMAECDSDYVLLDAPTLFESGLNAKCSCTIAVLADVKLRLSRICKRDNITETQAKLRINAGKSDDFYIENADYVIYNNDNIELLNNEFSDILKTVKER